MGLCHDNAQLGMQDGVYDMHYQACLSQLKCCACLCVNPEQGALNKGWRNEPILAFHDKFKCRLNFTGAALFG